MENLFFYYFPICSFKIIYLYTHYIIKLNKKHYLTVNFRLLWFKINSSIFSFVLLYFFNGIYLYFLWFLFNLDFSKMDNTFSKDSLLSSFISANQQQKSCLTFRYRILLNRAIFFCRFYLR